MMRPARDAGQPRVRNRMVCQPQLIGGMCVAVQRKYTFGFFRRDREANLVGAIGVPDCVLK